MEQTSTLHENSSSSASEIIPETEDTPADKPAGAVTDTSTEADKSDNLNDMYNSYADALENLLQNQILPDGTQAEGDMAQGKFALYDVDNDGKKELLFMAGNALNFALNLLGCFVHDLRLQCLEYFNKFYEDGGRRFRPLEIKTKYVDIVKE